MRGDFGPLNTGLRSSQGAFGRSLGQMESRAQRTFRRIGAFAKVGTVAGFAGLGIAAKKAFGEFEEAERATRQTEAVLKSTGGAAGVTAKHVEQLANAISLKSGKDDEAIQSAENLLLTFTSVRNEVGKGNDIFDQATSVIADMSAALGQDFKASTIQLGKALQDPIKGITALRRVGVNFNEQQTEMVKKMVESGDQLGAQKFILRELKTEFEGSAEAQATSSDKLRVALNNLLESFGKTFGPALSQAFTGLATFVTRMQTGEGAAGKFGDAMRGVFGGIGTLIEGTSDAIKGLIDRFGDLRTEGRSVPAAIGALIGQGISNIDVSGIGEKLGGAIEAGLDFGDKFAASVAEGIQIAISEIDGAKLLGGLVEVVAQALNALFSPKFWIDHFAAIFSIVTVVIPVGKILKIPGFETLFRFISAPFFKAVGAVGKGIAGLFGKAGSQAITSFLSELSKTFPRLANALLTIITISRKELGKLPAIVTGPLKAFGARITSGFETAGRAAGRALARALTAIIGPIATIAKRIGGAAVNPVLDLLRGAVGTFSRVGRRWGNALKDSFVGVVRGIGGVLKGSINAIIGLIERGINAATPGKIKLPGPIPDIPGVPDVKLKRLAKGGKAHGWAVVGEEGPELAHFSQPTDIVSNPLSKKMARSMGVPGFAKGTVSEKELQAILARIDGKSSHDTGTKQGRQPLGDAAFKPSGSLRTPQIQPSRVSQIVRTPEREFVMVDKVGKAIQVAESAQSIPIQITAPIVDLSAIESPALRASVQGAVKRHREPGGDAVAASVRKARSSQLAGVSVTPNEVTQITNKWSVNRAVASIGAAVKDKFPAMQIISGFRPGATTRGGSRSNHSIRAALDLGSTGSLNRRIGTWVRANFPSSLRGVSEGVLDIDHDPNPPDHADHVHAAALGSEAITKVMQQGADGTGVGKAPRSFRKLSLGQYITVAKKVGFPDPALAAAIFYAESRGNVNAVGDSGESLGAAQIHTPSHPRYDHKKLRDDVFYNFRAALAISKGGKTFQPWTQYRNAAYKQFMGGKARPLPKGSTKSAGGSTLADYIELKRTEALDTLSNKDDLRWINRALRYWRGVYRRNKRAGNIKRQTDALREIQTLKGERKGLKETTEEPELFQLGGLSEVGTGPNRFRIGGMQRVLDQIDLEKAQATLTIPRDDDPSQAGIAASLQDDIGAASKLVSIRDSLYKLTQGFRMPSRQLSGPFDPSRAQTEALNRTKSPQERITLLNRYIAEATQGPWIVGTIKQKIEAANDFATSREQLKSLTDEAGRKEETPETVSDAPDRAEDAPAFLASIRELLKNYASNISPFLKVPAFAKGGLAKGWAVVGEEGPELAHFSKPTEIISHPVSKKLIEQKLVEKMGIPGFAQGTPIQPSERVTTVAQQPVDMEKFVKQLVEAIRDNPRGQARQGRPDVHQTNYITYAAQQPEPHTLTRSLLTEMKAAV